MSKNKSKIVTPTSNSKKWLIAGASVLGAATITFGSLFSCASNGGGSYKPGTEVKVQAAVSDPTGGQYKVTFGSEEEKAVVGQKYHGTITLTPKNEDIQECYLPDKLVSVISNTTVLEEGNYTYTLDTATRKTATLDISADYVYGPIVINLALVTPSEPGPGPEPVDWKEASKEEVLVVRDNVLNDHKGKNPFDFLKEKLGGTQFVIQWRNYSDGGNGMLNAVEQTKTIQIDINNGLYVKMMTLGGAKKSETGFYTFHEGASGNGLYSCFLNGTTPTNQLIYSAETIEEAIKLFTPNSSYDPISQCANQIYGTGVYASEAPTKKETAFPNTLDEAITMYQTIMQTVPIEGIEMNYYTAGEQAFKIDNSYTDEELTIGTFTAIGSGSFNLEIVNSLLTSFYCNKLIYVEQTPGVVMSITEQVSCTIKKPDVPFFPDDLSPFFTE